MKLSEETISLLKNYATINSNLYVEAGSNEIRTWTVTKNIYAVSTIEEVLPVILPIYDLNEFLSVLDIFKDDADIEFGEESLTVGNGKSKVEYEYSDPSMLSYPNRNINPPEPIFSFPLSKEDIGNIISVSSKLSAPDISIKSIEGKLVVTVYHAKGDTGNTFAIEVCDYTGDVVFDVHLKTDNLRVIPKDYILSIFEGKAPLVHFKSTDEKNQYFIATEKTSVFQ